MDFNVNLSTETTFVGNLCAAMGEGACDCKVGIGVDPTEKLTVGGNISVLSGGLGAGGLVAQGGLSAQGANNYFSGNVGIGTTAPGSLLTVVSGDVSIFSSKCGGTAGQANLTDGILRFGKNFDNSGTKTANKIILYDDGGVGAQWKGGFGVNSNSIDFFSGDNFNFWTNHGSVDQGNNRFTILAGGNVGIGTDAPDYGLDVAGTVGINDYIYHNGDDDTYLKFEGNEVNLVAGGKSAIKLDYNNNTNDRIEINNTNADIDVQIMADDGEVILHTDAATNRVGIGTTSPAATLHVAGSAYIEDSATIMGNLSVHGDINLY